MILGADMQFGAGQAVALALAVLALALSAFFSGSEISYFSLTREQTDNILETPQGPAVKRLLDKPEKLLATILIANNLVNVTIVVLCNFALGPVFTGMNEVMSFVLQTILLTFLILLFGEIAPKLYANNRTGWWARKAVGAITFFERLFSPLSSLLVRSTSVVNRMVTERDGNITADDLEQVLEITDVRAPESKNILEGILTYGETSASEIMTPRVDMTDIPLEATFSEVMKVVVESGYSRLPVYSDSEDDIRGVLYSRDLLPYIGKADDTFDWRTLMRKPYFVPESRMIDDLLEDFRKRKIHLAIVVDEYGGTRGLVTLEDILEEIVGDIYDEYDEEENTYRRLPDDTYIFEGKALLNDFFRIIGQDETEYAPVAEDAETLAGMLLAIKGDFPKEKESLVYGHCRFLILDIDNHRIARVRVKVMPEVQTDVSVTTKA